MRVQPLLVVVNFMNCCTYLEGEKRITKDTHRYFTFKTMKQQHDKWAKEKKEADRLLEDAKLLQDAGCFAIILEKVPAELAKKVAEEINIPIIGIGAGGQVDGQVLVIHDMLGITQEFSPRFLRRYHNLFDEMKTAFQNYISDVKSKDFPNEKEQY